MSLIKESKLLEDMRVENENLLHIIEKKDDVERELRRNLQKLQREQGSQNKGSHTPDRGRNFNDYSNSKTPTRVNPSLKSSFIGESAEELK
jgi:hypothetical protein